MKKSLAMNVGAIGLAGLLAGLLAGCQDPQPGKQDLVRSGDFHRQRAEYVEAIGPYMKASELDPADANVLFQIGECHFFLRNYREAIKWYGQAIKSYPGHRLAAIRIEEAKRHLPNLAMPPSPESGPGPAPAPSPRVVAEGFIRVAQTYEAQKDLPRAQESYERAVAAADDLPFTHVELGRFYMRTGRSAEAVKQLKLYSNEPGVADDLARLSAAAP